VINARGLGQLAGMSSGLGDPRELVPRESRGAIAVAPRVDVDMGLGVQEDGRGGAGAVGTTALLESRLRSVLEQHYDFTWRALRRLGLDEAGADDAAQQVFVVAARKLPQIVEGGERAYLYGIAQRVASDARRGAARRREDLHDEVGGDVVDPGASVEEVLDQRRARAMLDAALAQLPIQLHAVFTLHELEDLSMSEIAAILEIPPGTVASRLRRARQEFEVIVARLGRAVCRPTPGRRGSGGRE